MSEAPTTPAPEATPVEAPAPAPTPNLREMADLWHVPMTDSAIKQISGDGEVTPERANAFQQYLQTAAQGLYPTFAPQLKAGIPTSALLEPYRQVAKQVMGDNFEPNFQTDPKARMALEGNIDPQTGRPAPMSLSQWTGHLKTDPSFGWMQSEQGQAERQAMLQRIHEAFGGK